jgi:preprotein translocase SecE subunit
MNRVVRFIKDAYAELKRVRFPSKKETIRLTAYVIGVSLATGLFVAGVDYLLQEGLAIILK